MPPVKVAMPASTEPTVSTLTTAAPTNDIGDGEDFFDARGGGGSKSEEEKDKELPPLKSVFDGKHLHLRTANDGKNGWECVWCGKIFAPRHAFEGTPTCLENQDGGYCSLQGRHSDRHCKRYLALLDSGKGWVESKKHLNQSIDESVALQQESAVGNLLKKRR